MLKIQVLGKGLIPRGLGLAPRKEPFPADLNLIGIILSTPGLKVNYIHPVKKTPMELTSKNLKAVYAQWANYVAPKETAKTTAPVAPVKAEAPKVAVPVKQEVKVEAPKQEVKAPVVEAPKAVPVKPEPVKVETPKAAEPVKPVEAPKTEEKPEEKKQDTKPATGTIKTVKQ